VKVYVTIEELAADRSSIAEMLPGRCRGDLLGPWGTNVAKRYGADGLARVRRRLAPPLDQLAPVLTAKDWVPILAQLRVTEAIVDEHLAGDWPALLPLIIEDARAGIGRIQLALLRSIGPGNAFRLTSRTLPQVYESGTGAATVEKKHARLEFTGNAVFAQPRWRLMQLFAMRTMMELAGVQGTATGEDVPDGFVAHARW
jgi:hypothetical protein